MLVRVDSIENMSVWFGGTVGAGVLVPLVSSMQLEEASKGGRGGGGALPSPPKTGCREHWKWSARDKRVTTA
jgi:hypothetical protein